MIRLALWSVIVLIIVGCSTCGGGKVSIQDKYEQMLFPTAYIETEKGSGSGVVIDSLHGYTVVLTASHVVKGRKKVRVRFSEHENEYPATVTKVSKEHDLAIVIVEHYEHDWVAYIGVPMELLVFQETYKVGSALGSKKPMVTTGVVSQVEDGYFFTSSPIIWGDSGGGIYIEEGGKFYLVGISVAISTGFGFPVFHMGIAVDMFSLKEFLDE